MTIDERGAAPASGISGPQEGIVVRRLTASDLGLFYAKRPEIQSKQRAININAAIIEKMLPRRILERGELLILCRRADRVDASFETRPLSKVGKNWRLGGPAIRDFDLSGVAADAFFIGSFFSEDEELRLDWVVLSQAREPQLYARLEALVSNGLIDRMLFTSKSERLCDEIRSLLAGRAAQKPNRPEANVAAASAPLPLSAELSHRKRARTVRDRVRSPHIMEEMLQVAGGLSGSAQQEFFDTITNLAEIMRDLLLAHNMIVKVPRDHSAAWRKVRNQLIAHVDGGVASLPALGAAPMAIRVGTYMVRPGDRSDGRERFELRPQLVDELFAAESGGIFAGIYPDIGAVRDAARMATEAAGAVAVVQDHSDVRYLLMHGALVNPVSRYSDMEDEDGNLVPFPSFSEKALDILVPFKKPRPEGDQAQFIPVYLEQLLCLQNSSAVVCGVVERPGYSIAVSAALIDALPDSSLAPLIPDSPPAWRKWVRSTLKSWHISDSLLLRCVLEEGEATSPVPHRERNELRRAPRKWRTTIESYPTPYISFILPSEWAGPVRVELFEKSLPEFSDIAQLLMHSSMLLPGYVFPVGLDTADKFAKIPNWMGRPVTSRMMVSALKRALESGNTKQIDALRHLLCGTERDFLFRPKP